MNKKPSSLAQPNRPGTLKIKRSGPDLSSGLFDAFASCPRGLETALIEELTQLGGQGFKSTLGGCEFKASWKQLLRMQLWSRIAGRMSLRVLHEPCTDEHQLYQLAAKFPWWQWFDVGQTFRTDLNNLGAQVQSLRFAQLKLKDAVCDAFRQKFGKRPDVQIDDPDVRLLGALSPTHLTLYVDLSGEGLFKRGWREDKGSAPLKENLAAGILALSGWTPDTPLFDPFCGSGTLVIEAAMIACDRAPGLYRDFGFTRLKPFEKDVWEKLLIEADERFEAGVQAAIDRGVQFTGSDITRKLVEMAQDNAERAGLGALMNEGLLVFEQIDARHIQPPFEHGVLLSNPPYGERIQAKGKEVLRNGSDAPDEADQAAYLDLFKAFGTVLKQKFGGWKVLLFSGDLELRHAIGLSPKRKTPLFNGPIECRLFEFPIEQGRYRPRAAQDSPDTPSA